MNRDIPRALKKPDNILKVRLAYFNKNFIEYSQK